MHIIVTAGGTREYIDPVRYISNASTGKMGYAIAQAAASLGHKVTLISTPTSLPIPKNVECVPVSTSYDMLQAVKEELFSGDVLIMAAAVSDYRPAVVSECKLKKHTQQLSIKLEPTEDILRWVAQNKTNQFIVGFALEDTNLLENASRKLDNKQLDMIIANSPAAIGADMSTIHILLKGGIWKSFSDLPKSDLAKIILDNIAGV